MDLGAAPRFQVVNGRLRRVVTIQDEADCQKVFDLFTGNKHRGLTFFEARAALNALGFDLREIPIQKIRAEMVPRKPQGRELKFDAFLKIATDMLKDRDPQVEIDRAFELFDKDNDGKIYYSDLKRVAGHFKETLTDKDMQLMIDIFDHEGEGYLTKKEFSRMCVGQKI